MTNLDVSSLKKNDMEYKEIIERVSAGYKGDWDDAVHDSFLKYVTDLHEYSRRVHELRCRTEVLQKEFEELKIDDVIRQSQELCREADAI